ncbi:MAG: aminotransferase class I/II-fold pyridoxal phosphate-dependent enzyme, partial [Muribaculaceae bacterium]|nr:aminotransferase class I/II-fold pyridoxal phosphate-dependent enzyme [Muribaculaceae bacterium]
DAETLRSVASICHRNGVKVIADEIHEDLMLWGIKHIPFASVSPEAEEISITLGAPSKTFNIAGLVSSWVVIKNKEMRESFFAWMKSNEFDDPTFFATTATIAAYNNGDEWLNQLIGYLEDNQLFLEEYLKREIPEIKAVRPQASFLTWLDCRDIYAGETDTHDKLDRFFIEKAGLALNNGFIFGKEGDGFMRFNIGCPRQTLQKALDQIKAALKS